MFTTFVVGVHESDASKQAALEARQLARAVNGAHVHLVVAVPNESVGGLRSAAPPARDKAQAQLDALVQEFAADESQVTTHAIPGKAAEAIVSVAEEVGADLIVIGSLGAHHRFRHSVPHDVVRTAPCTVMVVKTV